jgi:DNA-binding CsgD family transcriptional regulator
MSSSVDARLPEILSDLLLALSAACDRSPVSDFPLDALRLVQKRLPFDSAFWAAGVLGPRLEPVIQSVCLFNQPQEMLTSYDRVKHLDTILARAVAQFGTTVNVDVDAEFAGAASEAMKAHGGRFGIRQVLATMTRGPVSELMGAVSLYRSDPARPFSEQERVLQQCLAPHLVALCNRNRLQHIESSLHGRAEMRSRAAAIVDREGTLYNASALFIDLMREEWPEWRGPCMPPAMSSAIRDDDPSPLRLSRIAVHVSPVGDLVVLHIRRVGPGDRLSEREWEVAKSFGDGLSHKQIARVLHIAPSTVRNHLQAIYLKIGVGNKAELIHSLESTPR